MRMYNGHYFLGFEKCGNIVFRTSKPTFEAINYSITLRNHYNSCIAKLLFRFQMAGHFIPIHFAGANIK